MQRLAPVKGAATKANASAERARILGESKGRNSVHYCYILRCCDGSYYVGVSEDPRRRLLEHNDEKGADWTAARLPV